MSVVARLRESSVKGHHVYRTAFVVGAVFTCEREPSTRHSDWAVVVKKPGAGEVAGQVLDDIVQVLLNSSSLYVWN